MNRRKTADLGFMTMASLTPEESIINELHMMPKSQRDAAVNDLADKHGVGLGSHRTARSYGAYVKMLLGSTEIMDSMFGATHSSVVGCVSTEPPSSDP